MKPILITAHSGCEGTAENSLESILRGIALGADCVEIDVQVDEDGRLYLSHDPLPDPGKAVSFPDALRPIAESGIAVNCDLKREVALYPALAALEAAVAQAPVVKPLRSG